MISLFQQNSYNTEFPVRAVSWNFIKRAWDIWVGLQLPIGLNSAFSLLLLPKSGRIGKLEET